MATRLHMAWDVALDLANHIEMFAPFGAAFRNTPGVQDQTEMAIREAASMADRMQASDAAFRGARPTTASSSEPEMQMRVLARTNQVAYTTASHSDLWICAHADADLQRGGLMRPCLESPDKGVICCDRCLPSEAWRLAGPPTFDTCDVCGLLPSDNWFAPIAITVGAVMYRFDACRACIAQVDDTAHSDLAR